MSVDLTRLKIDRSLRVISSRDVIERQSEDYKTIIETGKTDYDKGGARIKILKKLYFS